jgi:hypothetical protein
MRLRARYPAPPRILLEAPGARLGHACDFALAFQEVLLNIGEIRTRRFWFAAIRSDAIVIDRIGPETAFAEFGDPHHERARGKARTEAAPVIAHNNHRTPATQGIGREISDTIIRLLGRLAVERAQFPSTGSVWIGEQAIAVVDDNQRLQQPAREGSQQEFQAAAGLLGLPGHLECAQFPDGEDGVVTVDDPEASLPGFPHPRPPPAHSAQCAASSITSGKAAPERVHDHPPR